MDEKEIGLLAIRKWGFHSQIGMLIEEIGELLTAINKYNREYNGTDYKGVIEELADVEIMLNQYKTILTLQTSKDVISDIIIIKNKKLEKLNFLLHVEKKKVRTNQFQKVGQDDGDPWPDEDCIHVKARCPECQEWMIWQCKKGFWCKSCGSIFQLQSEKDGVSDV